MDRIYLRDLPKELLFHTFTFLDGKTLITSCCSTCRLWKDFIDGSAELQYSIELWADGLVAGLSRFGSAEPAVERLTALYARRRAWETLNWTLRTVLPIKPFVQAYDLVHGVFAQQDAGLFTATWLQSIPDEETRTTSSRDLGIEPQDFTMDPTQDLVVFVYERDGEAMIECRSLTSLQAHSLAALPILSFSVEEPLGQLTVEIAGDVISVFRMQYGRTVVFNWRRGTMIMDIHVRRARRYPSTFTLLSPRAYILGCITGSGAIEIWEFEDGENKVPTHTATLQLPELAEDWMPGHIGAHGASLRAEPTPNKSFSQSNESRLYVISLNYNYLEYMNEMRCCLVVHHRYLENYLSQGGGPKTVPWEEWGPRHSRMIGRMDHKWMRYVSGERVVLPPSRGQQGHHALEVLDFSLNATRSPDVAIEPAVSSQFTSELCTTPTTIRDVLNMFKSAVTTTLPYRRTFRGIDEDHSSFMIDENHLIGVNDMETQITVYTF
ncbi:hypothetical protein B0H11DRAFT_271827 [Mycena galericulata]|nr:hypothetical protein B0H11DRAFT_271827 [Mycena galericulata]